MLLGRAAQKRTLMQRIEDASENASDLKHQMAALEQRGKKARLSCHMWRALCAHTRQEAKRSRQNVEQLHRFERAYYLTVKRRLLVEAAVANSERKKIEGEVRTVQRIA